MREREILHNKLRERERESVCGRVKWMETVLPFMCDLPAQETTRNQTSHHRTWLVPFVFRQLWGWHASLVFYGSHAIQSPGRWGESFPLCRGSFPTILVSPAVFFLLCGLVCLVLLSTPASRRNSQHPLFYDGRARVQGVQFVFWIGTTLAFLCHLCFQMFFISIY